MNSQAGKGGCRCYRGNVAFCTQKKPKNKWKGRPGFQWKSGMSLVEWPWLMQPRLNWLPKILSDPISILFRIQNFFFTFSWFRVLPSPLWATVQRKGVHTHLNESLQKAIFVSLGEKMKRFNINLFIPSHKHSSIFDLPHAHICGQHCETKQKADWSIIFIEWMAPHRI